MINERKTLGSKFIENLAADIRISFPNVKGYSVRNLKYMAKFAETYPDEEFVQTVSAQIPWGHTVVLLDKFAEARRAELTLWDAANRYLHAHLPEGVKTLPISAWEKEYTALKTQRDSDYTKLKDTRAEVAELQKIRRCVDIALRADQPEQTQSRTKRQEQ